MSLSKFTFIILGTAFVFLSCGNSKKQGSNSDRSITKSEEIRSEKNQKQVETTVSDTSDENLIPESDEIQYFDIEIVRTIPHDINSYTQGLLVHNGYIYESTGQRGESTLQKIDQKTGEVLMKEDVPARYFAEGISLHKNKIYMLTWRAQKCLVYDLETFILEKEYDYYGEGWGLEKIGDLFAMSDGSNTIKYLDPETFRSQRLVSVTEEGLPIKNLNELEYIQGNLWANVWMSSEIVVFDPFTGKLKAHIDLMPMYEYLDNSRADVINGIAYDEVNGKIYLTGKYWDKIYEVKLANK